MIRRVCVTVATAFLFACGSSPAVKPFAGPVAPPPTPATSPPPKSKQLDAASFTKQLDAYVGSIGRALGEAQLFTGFVFVGQGDRVIYERGWGYANHATKTRADRNTSFRIGSVTKQFTATAILQLQQKGRLSVTDKVRKHLPNYPAVAKDITIHHLLTHTSGIPNYTSDKVWMKRRGEPISAAALIATFWAKPLDFPPGSKFSYSNSGYAVLGAIIEAVSNKSYPDYLRDHVFAPAGLTRTWYGDAKGADNRALGYRVDKADKLVAAKNIAMSVAYAAGGVRSTAADMWRWHRAIETDALLSAASRKQMYTPFKKRYAYGWVVAELAGHKIIAHDGGIDGFGTSYIRMMGSDVTIVVWTNNQELSAGSVSKAAAYIVLGKKVEPVKQTVVADALAKRVVGSYVLEAKSKAMLTKLVSKTMADSVAVMSIVRRGNSLVVDPKGQPAIRMDHKKGLVFVIAQVKATLTFIVGKNGSVTGMTLLQGGMTLIYKRKP